MTPGEAKPCMGMMDSKSGAVNAVHAVMAALDKKSKVPPDVAVLLGPVILMLLVDFGKVALGKQPPPKVLQEVTKALMTEVSDSYNTATQSPQLPEQTAQKPVAPMGMIGAAA